MRTFKVRVSGTTPYMQHRMDDKKLQKWEEERHTIIERDGLTTEPLIKAAKVAYINDNGEYYIPREHFQQSFIMGGKYTKSKVGTSTKTMGAIVASMFSVNEEQIPFRKFDNVFEISAINTNVKARIMTYRPEWNTPWEASFTLNVDDNPDGPITELMIANIIRDAGRYEGVGSYRPNHKGSHGKFVLEELELIESKPSYMGGYFDKLLKEGKAVDADFDAIAVVGEGAIDED